MSVGQHLSQMNIEQYEQELLQDPGIQDAYVDFEMQFLDGELLAQNRLLTEVDHLLAQRTAPNTFGDTRDVLQNMETSMQEQAMPYAVTTTEHDIEIEKNTNERVVRWLGRTAVQVAASGYEFHSHESALKRVAVEVDEAYRASGQLDDGTMRVFISPRMSRKDAPLHEARQEHLGDDDAIRVSWVKTLPDGTQKRVLQSLLVRDIPLSAWVAMFEDSSNVFGKSLEVEDPESALSIMKLHSQLDIDSNKLPNGPVTLIEAVIPYIEDSTTRRKVIEHLKKYYGDQNAMQREAESKAREWLAFDEELAESLYQEKATSTIKSFVYSLQHEWGAEDLSLLKRHELPNAGYRMTRELAAMLESAQQKILAGRAALTTNPEHVLKKLGGDNARLLQLQDTEKLLSIAQYEGINQNQLLAMHIRAIATNNIDGGGGGCAGSSSTEFGNEADQNDPLRQQKEGDNPESKSNWTWKKGICRVESCSTRPGQTEVGPCDICHDCQDKFDKGEDPTENFQGAETDRKSSIAEMIIQQMLENRKATNEQFTTTA